MRIAAAQLNQVVGDFPGNSQRIIAAAQQATARGARVLLTPELSLCGYPPEDLLLRAAFHEGCERALAAVCEATAALDLYLLVGHPRRRDGLRYNGASLLHRGRVVGEYDKHELPNYDVFDEERYFEPADRPLVFEVDGVRFGVLICEDFWYRHAPGRAHAAGAQVILAMNASPFHMNKQHVRIDAARDNVSRLGLPMLAANLVGGQDELVFDGLSFALGASGSLSAQAPAFREDLLVAEHRGRRGAGLCSRRDPADTAARRADLRGAGARRARLSRQERLSRRHHRPVGRHRLGTDAGDRGRCAGRRPGARGHDGVAVHRGDLAGRRARHGGAARRALRRDCRSRAASTRSWERSPTSSAAWRRTPPRRTSRRASAARC